jgi:hypothetical protein
LSLKRNPGSVAVVSQAHFEVNWENGFHFFSLRDVRAYFQTPRDMSAALVLLAGDSSKVHATCARNLRMVGDGSADSTEDFAPSVIADTFYASSASTNSGKSFNLALVSFPFSQLGSLEIGNIGIEVKLSESKHRMQELTGVSKDVVTATHGMAMEIVKRAQQGAGGEHSFLFIPVVVTTAKLFMANTDVSKVALSNGTLAKEGLELKRLPWLVYEYALTADLLLPVNMGSDRSTPFATSFSIFSARQKSEGINNSTRNQNNLQSKLRRNRLVDSGPRLVDK